MAQKWAILKRQMQPNQFKSSHIYVVVALTWLKNGLFSNDNTLSSSLNILDNNLENEIRQILEKKCTDGAGLWFFYA